MTQPAALDVFTDGDAMRRLLQARLPGFADGSLRIDQVGVRQARRNTSLQRNPRRLTVCYELQVQDLAQPRRGAQLLYGEVFRDPQAAASALADADRPPLVTPAFGQPRVHLPELNLVLWALPNDPGLPQLATLLDPGRVAAHLPGPTDGPVEVDLLRYEPCQRATLRYRWHDAAGAPQCVYGKTFRDERAATIDARFRYFWQHATDTPQAPLVAQPLGHDAATHCTWQAPAPGRPLREVLQQPDAPVLLARVADALAGLHAAPLAPWPGTPVRSAEHWLAEVGRRQRKIDRIDASLAPRVARIAAAIEAHAERECRRPCTLIHGDFHPDQIWVHDGRIVLFDFDEFTLGDPMEDLAEFVLKLEQLGARPALVSALVARYAAAAPQRFDRASLHWHLAIQSLLQSTRAFIYQQPGWAESLQQRLADSESRAAALATPGTP
jgi:aminoglycoside phosphotransferase (APT) family kinase protein